jgi:hypothetical protein
VKGNDFHVMELVGPPYQRIEQLVRSHGRFMQVDAIARCDQPSGFIGGHNC